MSRCFKSLPTQTSNGLELKISKRFRKKAKNNFVQNFSCRAYNLTVYISDINFLSLKEPAMNERMNEWKNEWKKEWMKGWITESMNQWINKWVKGWINKRKDEWMKGWMNERMKGWINGWMTGWMNEWMVS